MSIPLVIVEGFLCGAGPILWGNFEEHSNYTGKVDGKPDRKVFFASVGPVSSLHDRACELFYLLKGGKVDYGEEHSTVNDHGRFGRTHAPGLYPAWCDEKPLHFMGHSMGGATIVKLQWLLQRGFFGPEYGPDMVCSVTAVSAPFRGTQLVYALGEDTHEAPAVAPCLFGSAAATSVHLLSYLGPMLPGALDMHADARALSFRESTPLALVRQMWHSNWAESVDATPYDVTFEAVREREGRSEGLVSPKTYYRSYAACMTRRIDDASAMHTPQGHHLLTVPPLYFSSQAIGSFDHSALKCTPTALIKDAKVGRPQSNDRDTEPQIEEICWANDGVVPVFSQWHPLDCSATRCKHAAYLEQGDDRPPHEGAFPEEPQSGIWYVRHVEDATHISLVPIWLGTARQKAFWRDLGSWLCAIDRKLAVS